MALKRKYIDIELPILESSVAVFGSAESLKGRTVKLDLTRKLKGKSIEAIFQIFNIDNKLVGMPKQLNLMKFYIIRMMRKGTNYVEDSFSAECKDVKVSIKPFLITRKKVSRAVRNNLRKTAKDFLLNNVKEKTYLQVCYEILTGTLQREMLPKLKKVYPLSLCEIRLFETKEMNKIDQNLKIEQEEEAQEVQEIQPELAEQVEVEKETKEVKEEVEKKKRTSKKKDE